MTYSNRRMTNSSAVLCTTDEAKQIGCRLFFSLCEHQLVFCFFFLSFFNMAANGPNFPCQFSTIGPLQLY